jgi:N-acetylglucosamine-6-phosphate deacetylase
MKKTALVNGRIITPLRLIEDGTIIIKDNTIIDFGSKDQVTISEDTVVIDVNQAYISPGFIDLHIHGSWGGDVMSASEDDLVKMANGLVRCGVTSFMPTTLSGSLAELRKIASCVEKMGKVNGGARLIGLHLEGPYLNPKQVGAQNPKYIICPDPADYLPLFDKYSCIKRVSAAPEISGGMALGRELKKRGIIASIAHSSAVYQEVLAALENGYTHATHIFSGMSSVQRVEAYRVTGVLESVLLLDDLTTEIIADGHHLPPSLIKLVLKSKGLNRVCLVTDAMSAAGLGPGEYNLGGLEVIVEDAVPEIFEIETQKNNYVAKLSDRSAFASSVATMNQMVRNMVKLVGLNLPEAVCLATINPARMQKLDDKIGLIGKGMKADLTVFNEEFDILLTMVDGEIVYIK